MSTAPGARHPVWLLTRLKLRRLGNQFFAMFHRPLGRKRVGSAPVQARKSRTRLITSTALALVMFAGFTSMSVQALHNLEVLYGTVHGAAGGTVLTPGVIKGVTLQLSMFVLAALCVTLGNRSLSHSDWDLEWLVTLPVERSTLLVSRIVERSATNPAGLLALWPTLTVLAWRGGFRWSAPLVGLAFTVPLQVLIAVLQTLADTGLRLSWSPAKLRNLQAAFGLLGAVLLYAGLSMQSSPQSPVLIWIRSVPDWTVSLPTGTAVQALASIANGPRLLGAAVLVVEIAAFFILGLWILQRQLRFGVVAGGVREAGKRFVP